MKYYLKQNVYEAALDRIRWLFDEFPNIVVNVSGGKDSTVVLHLALKVAEERGRLPLKVLFIDQEAEWQTVIEHIRLVMSDPRIEPQWLQCPIKIFNATSNIEPWLNCWEPGKTWIREKEAISIKENVFGTDRFTHLFEGYNMAVYPKQAVAHIAGVRGEESPARQMGLTTFQTYKQATWGKKENTRLGHYTFYPIYDWHLSDVWKAIHDNAWPYCPIYDYMYQQGVPVFKMRVSNVHHETAVHTLFYLQEIESDTWNRITARISGLDSAGKLQQDFYAPKVLPPMFKDWREYRDHLLENLIPDPVQQAKLAASFKVDEERYDPCIYDAVIKMHLKVILTNDLEDTSRKTFIAANIRHLMVGNIWKREHGLLTGSRTANLAHTPKR